jgi:muramoyltetrapeptide carboxypeptidase
MAGKKVRIGIVAPACRIIPRVAEQIVALGDRLYPDRVELRIHPQCFESSGHFAGDDDVRARAFLEYANDQTLDAVWFARGGYGSGRIATRVLPGLAEVAHRKIYLGYSDAAALLGAMYSAGFRTLFHGPMPADFSRKGGESAVVRSLSFLVERDLRGLEPSVTRDGATAAFNITILGHLLGTRFEPDLSGHTLMLEEISEHMYRIDRGFMHITSAPGIRRVAGIRLGRCSDIPENDPEFGENEEQVAKHWCQVSGIPYLGRADIGHDIDNKIVPFGVWNG